MARWRRLAGLDDEQQGDTPMANGIAFAENFTSILDAVYQHSSVSRCLNSGNRIV